MDAEAVIRAVKHAEAEEVQVVTVAVLGHKADVGFVALGADLWRLRASRRSCKRPVWIWSTPTCH